MFTFLCIATIKIIREPRVANTGRCCQRIFSREAAGSQGWYYRPQGKKVVPTDPAMNGSATRPQRKGPYMLQQYLLASDFDQTLSFNDSAWCLPN